MNPYIDTSSAGWAFREKADMLDDLREVAVCLDGSRKDDIVALLPDARASANYYDRFLALNEKVRGIFSNTGTVDIQRNGDEHAAIMAWLTAVRTYGAAGRGKVSCLTQGLIKEVLEDTISCGLHAGLHPAKHFCEGETVYPAKQLSAAQQVNDVFCHSRFWRQTEAVASLFSGECLPGTSEDLLQQIGQFKVLRQNGKDRLDAKYLKGKRIFWKQDADRVLTALIGDFRPAKDSSYYAVESGHFSHLSFNPNTGSTAWKNWQASRDDSGNCRILRLQTNVLDQNDETGKVHLEFDPEQHLTVIREQLQPPHPVETKASAISMLLYKA